MLEILIFVVAALMGVILVFLFLFGLGLPIWAAGTVTAFLSLSLFVWTQQ